MSDAELTDKHTEDVNTEETLSPTSIVLAKVKGYPPWPAMVLDENLLPQNIIDKRPKSVHPKRSKRSRGKPITILPVRFFSDDTYIWIKDSDLKTMTTEMIDTHLNSDKKRKDKLLEKAYQLAKSPPDMEEFVKWGSRGPPKDKKVESETSTDYGYVEDDFVVADDVEDEDVEESEEEEDEEDEEVVFGRRRKKQKTAKKEKKEKKNKKAKQDKNELGYDSDWGLDDEEVGEDDYIFDGEEQEQFEKKFPKAADLTERLQEAQDEFNGVNFEITLLLLEDNINEKEVIKALAPVKKMDIPYTLLGKSSLFKALVLTARKPQDAFPYPKLKKEINKILELRFGMQVDENTPEMMEKEEKEETPMDMKVEGKDTDETVKEE